MDLLRETDLQAVLGAIRLIDAEDGGSFPQRATSALRALVPCDVAGYYELLGETGGMRALVVPDTGRRTVSTSVRPPRRVGTPAWSTPMRSPAPLPSAERAATTGPMSKSEGFFHRLGLADAPNEQVFVVVHRRNPAFTGAEIRRLAELQPHLVARYRADSRLASRKSALGLPHPEENDCCSSRLSQREMEVMTWVARGKTNEEAATILGTSPLTVKKHLENVYAKLDTSSRVTASLCFAACREARGRVDAPPAAPSKSN